MNSHELTEYISKIVERKHPPDTDEFLPIIKSAVSTLQNESDAIRPRDNNDLPGGLINLHKEIPTLIVPDLHARINFIVSLLFWNLENNNNVLNQLFQKQIQILCVGDGIHAEGRAVQRWQKAYNEFQNGYKHRKAMDEEMKESFGLMQIVMLLKSIFPENFHFLKGNHENIANETKDGNFGFAKYVMEGAMVADYVKKFYSNDFLLNYYIFEKSLPLLAVGHSFIVSHAQPRKYFGRDEIINYRENIKEIVTGLTWTDNGASLPGTCSRMLEDYLPGNTDNNSYKFYFGGHRPIRSLYREIDNEAYYQIHNPNEQIVAYFPAGLPTAKPFDPETDIQIVPEWKKS